MERAGAAGSLGAEQLGLLLHDLRTPIRSIRGAAQGALESARSGAQVEEYLTQILSAASALDAMAGELLGAGRAEVFTGEMLLCDLRALVAPLAQEKRQSLALDLSALSGRAFTGERAALCRILQNLLTNAVKYTQEGGHIALYACLTDGEPMRAVFTVEDDGMGMKRAFMGRMFDPLARAPESRGVEGSGLGLASVKRLVEALGGEIAVDSRWGAGTRFTVCVPLPETPGALQTPRAPQPMRAPQAAASPAGDALRGERLLVAEDNALAAQIVCARLTSQGAHVTLASDGAQALDRFARSRPGAFTAALLDLRMPSLGGAQTAMRLRALPREDAQALPLVAMTASAGEGDRARALRAGFDACLEKPIDPEQLRALLAQARARDTRGA